MEVCYLRCVTKINADKCRLTSSTTLTRLFMPDLVLRCLPRSMHSSTYRIAIEGLKPLTHIFYPTTQKVAEYYVIPSEDFEILSVCPSVRLSVRPSALRFRTLT